MTEKKKKIFFNLNPKDDWLHFTALRLCSEGARGLWMDMECLMYGASDYGYLLLNDEPATDDQIAILTGIPLERLTGYMAELEKNGVLLRNSKRIIYSRRLIEQQKKSATAKRNGKNGGNPSLGKDKENPASDNPQDKPPDNLKNKSKSFIKEKNNTKKEKIAETGELWFHGKHIRLGRADYDRWLELSGMENDAFWKLLGGRDSFYVDHPHVSGNWYAATEEYIEKIGLNRGEQ